MAGSLGTLGVILEVSLKCLPLPRAETTRTFDLPADEALRKLNARNVASGAHRNCSLAPFCESAPKPFGWPGSATDPSIERASSEIFAESDFHAGKSITESAL